MVPRARNEVVQPYAPGSRERAEIETELDRQEKLNVSMTSVIDGKSVESKTSNTVTAPHDHSLKLGVQYWAGPADRSQIGRLTSGLRWHASHSVCRLS